MSSESQTCLGYLWLKGYEGDLATEVQNWTCSLSLLRNGKLIHFDIDPKTSPKGMISLEQAQAEVSTGPVPGALYASSDCFKCVTPQRTFHLYAENNENRNKWVSLLTDHINKIKKNPSAFDQSKEQNFELREQISTSDRVEFLTKSGGIKNLSWKKRLFVLNGKNLVYYELPQGLRAQGNYLCQSCSPFTDKSVTLPEEISSDRVMIVHTDRGKLLVGVLNSQEKLRWSEALMTKSFKSPTSAPTQTDTNTNDTQQLLARRDELQKQIDELSETKEKSEKVIRALTSGNNKLKQTVEELTNSVKQKEEQIARLNVTKQRMESEVIEAKDYQKSKRT